MDHCNRAGQSLFTAVLKPHRSLGPRGFLALMGLLAAVSFAAGIAFLVVGAWPVFGFFGLDLALVYLAFRASYRSGQAREEIDMTAEALTLRRFAPNGRLVSEIILNPYWSRLQLERDHEGRLTRIRLASHGARHELADALGPTAREGLAAALSQALAAVRTR